VSSPSVSGGKEDFLKFEGAGTSGLSSKIKSIEDQIMDQTEAMEKSAKIEKFSRK